MRVEYVDGQPALHLHPAPGSDAHRGSVCPAIGHSLRPIAFWDLSLWLPAFWMSAREFTANELMWAAAVPYSGYFAGIYVGAYPSDRTGKRAAVSFSLLLIGAALMPPTVLLTVRVETVVVLRHVLLRVHLGDERGHPASGLLRFLVDLLGCGIENGLSNGLGTLGPVLVGAAVGLTGSTTRSSRCSPP